MQSPSSTVQLSNGAAIPAAGVPTGRWIAVDWGTTHVRAWLMEGAAPQAEAQSDQGMNSLAPDAFEAALLTLIEPWLETAPITVIACGMVGARQGWTEAAYRVVPGPPLTPAPVRAPVRDPRLTVLILPGLSQSTPPDVMRGEETQIAGFLAEEPDFDGVLCLPGTHTKWAHISAGEVVSFRTFMSGELFALLSGSSVLRHSVAAEGWDDAAFDAAVSEALSRPESLTGRLFELRAAGLLADQSPQTARARLSGLLIGAELAAARPYWLGRDVALIGSAALSRIYAQALAQQGLTARLADAGAMTRRGLAQARALIQAGP